MISKQFWQNYYDNVDLPWDRKQVGLPLLQWIKRGKLAPCDILIPGCGDGYEVVFLTSKQYRVTAVDYISQAIDKTEKKLNALGLKAILIKHDLLTWKIIKPVTAIYDQATFCAIHPNDWRHYQEQLYHWLKVGGKLLIQFMQTNAKGGPPYHCDIDYMKQVFSAKQWFWHTSDPEFILPFKEHYNEYGYCLEKIETK